MEIYKDRDSPGLASFYDRDITHYSIIPDQKESVIITTLDHWYKSSGLDRITFLKVDVQGYGLEVFKGCAHMLSSSLADSLQFEFGGCNIDSKTYFRGFFSLLSVTHGFKLYRFAPRKRLVHMNRYGEALECLTWQNIVGFKYTDFIPSDYTIVYE